MTTDLSSRVVLIIGAARSWSRYSRSLPRARRASGPHGITVNAACHGLFDTELTRRNASDERLDALQRSFPVQRLGTPEELAELICFLASDAAGYINGASIDINGGTLMM